MISLQLWTLRDLIADEGWAATIDRLADVGFEHVEPYDVAHSAGEILPVLERRGLTTPTAHGDLRPGALACTLDGAAAIGAQIVMHPAFLADDWAAPDGIARIAETLQTAADAAESYGIRVAFHNHADELALLAPDGRPALIALFDRLGPSVGVQFDPYWTTIARADVLETIDALDSRIVALHLKDGPIGGPNESQVAVGDGDLALVDYLASVPDSTPRVISLDMIASDPLAAVVRSKRWLDRFEEGGAGGAA